VSGNSILGSVGKGNYQTKYDAKYVAIQFIHQEPKAAILAAVRRNLITLRSQTNFPSRKPSWDMFTAPIERTSAGFLSSSTGWPRDRRPGVYVAARCLHGPRSARSHSIRRRPGMKLSFCSKIGEEPLPPQSDVARYYENNRNGTACQRLARRISISWGGTTHRSCVGLICLREIPLASDPGCSNNKPCRWSRLELGLTPSLLSPRGVGGFTKSRPVA
jgi:hypothetical protein